MADQLSLACFETLGSLILEQVCQVALPLVYQNILLQGHNYYKNGSNFGKPYYCNPKT